MGVMSKGGGGCYILARDKGICIAQNRNFRNLGLVQRLVTGLTLRRFRDIGESGGQ